MLIKSADDQSAVIAELERQVNAGGPDAKRAAENLRIRRAGLKGEAESAYVIDFEFGSSSRNWMVIHDLRLEHGDRVAQIDHLLINRWMDVYVLESKHFHAGLKVADNGEFLQWNNFRRTYLGMASPLEQNERHIAVLRDVMQEIDLPVRLGMRIAPTFHSLVLVSPAARIDRSKRFDSSRVIKADALKKAIWKDIDDENLLIGAIKTAAKVVSRETAEYVARQLVERHKPLERPAALAPPSFQTEAPKRTTATPPVTNGPACKKCEGRSGAILHGRFGYYFKCQACDANTSIKFTCQPGHAPRLRKDGLRFLRECAECGSSTIYHQNASEASA